MVSDDTNSIYRSNAAVAFRASSSPRQQQDHGLRAKALATSAEPSAHLGADHETAWPMLPSPPAPAAPAALAAPAAPVANSTRIVAPASAPPRAPARTTDASAPRACNATKLLSRLLGTSKAPKSSKPPCSSLQLPTTPALALAPRLRFCAGGGFNLDLFEPAPSYGNASALDAAAAAPGAHPKLLEGE
jgi:hypothetical protein